MKLYLWDRSWAALRRVRHRMNRSRRPAIPGAGQQHDWPPGGGLPVRLAPSIVAALATLRGRDAGAAPRASSCSAQYRWNVVLPQRSRGPRRHGRPGRWCRHVHQGVEATERHVSRTPGCGDIVQAERAARNSATAAPSGRRLATDIRANATAPAQRPPREPRDRERPDASLRIDLHQCRPTPCG